jgi:acyl-homoserine lactone acylase PvdQ
MYGMGYAAAQDRLWLFDLLRSVGRGRASEKLGPSPTTYGLDQEFGGPAGYSEQELTGIVDNAVRKLGPNGALFLNDTQQFVAGMNAYLAFLQTPAGAQEVPQEYNTLGVRVGAAAPLFPPAQFTVNDIVANAVLIQSALGLGGGGEISNLRLLQALDASIGPATTTLPQTACETWRDLRHANAADTYHTASGVFDTQVPKVSEVCPQALPAGTALWDKDSLRTRTLFVRANDTSLPLARARKNKAAKPATEWAALNPAARERLRRSAAKAAVAQLEPVLGKDPGSSLKAMLNQIGMPLTSSNWIAASGSETESGHPIMVAGPQTGYFQPQLLWEAAVFSKGGTPMDVAARGISTVNLPYIVIGRGLDFAWSPTSAGSDFTDTRVSKLCNLAGSPLGATPSRDDTKNNGSGAAGADGFPDADGYLNKGRCVRFYRRIDTWTAVPTAASQALGGPPNAQRVTQNVLRTHYGPVFATATVAGEPVAISTQRSTFLADVDTTAPFALMTTQGNPMSQARFKRLFNSMTATFNWLYTDHKDIAFIQSGLYPLRHPDVHAELPAWGDGNFEWGADSNLPANFFDRFGGDGNNGGLPFPSRNEPIDQDGAGYYEWPGYLPLEAHIQDSNPAQGFMANWNNSGARGWWAADGNGTYGPSHRVLMLSSRMEAFKASGRKHNLASMIEIMGDAAFTDLRGLDVFPLMRQLLAQAGPALSADQQAVLALLQAWVDEGSQKWISNQPGLGALRRDRDNNGVYDSRAAVVFMDAWYRRLIPTVLPQMVALEGMGVGLLSGRYDAPRGQGSAFQSGWFQHMKRSFTMALGTPGKPAYRQLKCAGTGTIADCRAALLTAMDQAITDLGGVANQANWDGSTLPNAKNRANAAVEDYDSVEATSFASLPIPAIHWINRPTWQQVAEIYKDRNGKLD